MQYDAIAPTVSATPVDHEGQPLVIVTINGEPFVMDRPGFELLFRPRPEPGPIMRIEITQSRVEEIGAAAVEIAERIAADNRPARQPNNRGPVAQMADYSDYPVSLRDPRADSQRSVYDILQPGPLSLDGIVTRLKKSGVDITSAAVFKALMKLRSKGLAKKLDSAMGGDWILC